MYGYVTVMPYLIGGTTTTFDLYRLVFWTYAFRTEGKARIC